MKFSPAFQETVNSVYETEDDKYQRLVGALEALAKKGAVKITIGLRGDGDSGYSNGMDVWSKEGKLIPGNHRKEEEIIDDFIWDLAGAYASGFEDNEGGSVLLELSLKDDVVSLLFQTYYNEIQEVLQMEIKDEDV